MANKEIKGIYSPSKDGKFGFIDVEGEKKGYYVHSLNRKNVLPGDEVLAKVKIFKGKQEAVIKKILKRNDKIFSGIFEKVSDSFGFVKVKEESFSNDIFIPFKYINNAKNGDFVGVKILKWNGKNPTGKIIKIFGDLEKNEDLIIDSFILEAGFKEKFDFKVRKELKKLPKKVIFNNKITNSRKDLRNLFTFTIDSEDARDLDDAISIKKRKNGNIELFVHIADVAQYIKEGSFLDKEALFRGTSVYLPHKVLPMLPKELSNNLCSLNLDGAKLTLTCEMLIGKDGVIRKIKVYESIIKSNFRLTYKEIDYIKENKLKLQDKLFCEKNITQELIENVEIAWELKERLEKNRKIKGNLDFDFPETKIIFEESINNKDLIVKKIIEYPKYKSNKMIELFMVSANYSVSKTFNNLPFLYRIHPKPVQEDIENLKTLLNIFGVKFNFKDFSTKEFQELLEKISTSSNKMILEKIILRTLKKALYSTENEGHFGLGLDYYSHFTSPIRRYPDLQIHRIIKEKISGKLTKSRLAHYKDILKKVSIQCSEREIAAEKLEYKIRDYFICKYYKNYIGENFEAIIYGVTNKGIFVMLKDTTEGFIQLNDNKNYIFYEDLLEYKNKKNGTIYKIGNKINVKLIEVDFKLLRIIFDIY